MSEVRFEKARPEDYEDVIDLGNYVFSQASVPHDYVRFLPKLYKQEYFMDSIHYLAREGRKIRAVIGAYPLEMEFSDGSRIPGRGIGMVSVHPNCRSRGYMKTLMNMALDEMKKDGMVFSCLSGRRQRYEYYGFTQAGCNYIFSVREHNIYHTLGREWISDLGLTMVKANDGKILDSIQALHESKNIRFRRDRERLFDILCSWKSQVFALVRGDNFEGYLVFQKSSNEITEINLREPALRAEAIGVLLRFRRALEAPNSQGVHVFAGPGETEKLKTLSGFAEDCRYTTAYQYSIFDFKCFTEPLFRYKARGQVLGDGAVSLKINNEKGTDFILKSRGGKPEFLDQSNNTDTPEISLTPMEAQDFLFNPFSKLAIPGIAESVFLQTLLPLPLFFELPDGI